jgi:4-coumarate--CoA ligase (photoactive yellow protein activation family)
MDDLNKAIDLHFETIIVDLLLAQLKRLHPQKNKHLMRSGIHLDADLRHDLDLDSLDLMQCATAVATFFNVYDSGIEDTFLAQRTPRQWVAIVQKARQMGAKDFTFESSGSMGAPKLFRHSEAWLNQESLLWANSLKAQYPFITRVLSCVPSHHIYGFIWTCLLPVHLGVECQRLTVDEISSSHFKSGDLIIAVPNVWEYISKNCDTFPTNVVGISSTSPMPLHIFDRLIQQNALTALWQIYGSSETAGIAASVNGGKIFQCLANIILSSDSELTRTNPEGEQFVQSLPDTVTRLSSKDFTLGLRKDDVVKVAGNRVSLQAGEQIILQCPQIYQTCVRVDSKSDLNSLKAFIVPHVVCQNEAQQDVLLLAVNQFMAQKLRSFEIPRTFTIGAELPSSLLGKPIDW